MMSREGTLQENELFVIEATPEGARISQKIKENGYDAAILAEADIINAKNQVVNLRYKINGFYKETLYALSLAVKEVLGDFFMNTKEGASGPIVPQLISINLPDGTEVKVPSGRIPLNKFGNDCYIESSYDDEVNVLVINARIRQSGEGDLEKIISTTKRIIKENSIYKAKPLVLEFDEYGCVSDPEFLDLSGIDDNKILYSQSIREGLVPILARIKNTEACIEQDLDLKLGVLMEGPYGTGKTLTAFNLANIAAQYGWTFLYVKECKYFANALTIAENFARNDNGVIVFTEDIDQLLRGERDASSQDVLNTLDGGDNKNLPIISIFTTNHIEVIEPTFLRGKRIGSLISFGMLDDETATQFIQKLVVDKNNKSIMEEGDISRAVNALCGIAPAFASEVIDKAKAFMIHRGDNKITQDDIVSAANSYKAQMEYAVCRKIEVNTIETNVKSLFSEINKDDKRIFDALVKRLELKDYMD